MPREGHDHPSKKRLYFDRVISIHVPREGHDEPRMSAIGVCSGFQSTCPARGTTLCLGRADADARNFNPRAPRGARRRGTGKTYGAFAISIHVPREGHDMLCQKLTVSVSPFQSTCPARGTTPPKLGVIGTDAISIHVPREGHDADGGAFPGFGYDFNPRAPRGARRDAIPLSSVES